MKTFKEFLKEYDLLEFARNTGNSAKHQPKSPKIDTPQTPEGEFVDSISGVDIYKKEYSNCVDYTLFEDNIYGGELFLDKVNDSRCPYKNALKVSSIFFSPKISKRNIAYNLYKKIIKEYVLIMDIQVSENAINIWEKLTNENNIIVDVINYYTYEVIETNKILKRKSKEIWKEFDFDKEKGLLYYKGTNKILSPDDEKIGIFYTLAARSK